MKIAELLSESFLTERADWIILPATMALYNKRTVDLVTAASEWKNHATTILICTKAKGYDKERFCFVSSSGDCFDEYEKRIGNSFEAQHDQTMQSKGLYKLVNVVVLKDGDILKKANETGLKAKASLSVFK
jgi:hypothetical protein